MLSNRRSTARRHLGFAVEMERARYGEMLSIGKRHERPNPLQLGVAGGLVHRANHAKCYARRLENASPFRQAPLPEYLIQDGDEGAGIFLASHIRCEAGVLSQMRAADRRQEAAQLALLVEQGHDKPASVAAAIMVGERIGRLGPWRAMRHVFAKQPALDEAGVGPGAVLEQGGLGDAAFAGSLPPVECRDNRRSEE